MIALEVTINEGKPVIAGTEELCVLCLLMNAGPMCGMDSQKPEMSQPGCDIVLSLSGLTSGEHGEHVDWEVPKTLKIGDEVRIRIIETSSASPALFKKPEFDESTWHRFLPAKAVAFEIAKNKVPFFTAGRKDLDFLSLDISAIGQLGDKSQGTESQMKGESREGSMIMFGVGGHATEDSKRVSLMWTDDCKLALNDEISIKILDSLEYSKPLIIEDLS